MKVVYRHVFTVTVEGVGSFDKNTDLARIESGAEADARLLTLMVKRGGIDPKPVRSTRHTTTHVTFDKDDSGAARGD